MAVQRTQARFSGSGQDEPATGEQNSVYE